MLLNLRRKPGNPFARLLRRRQRRSALAHRHPIAVPIVERLENRVLLAAAGSLDPTFDADGRVTTSVGLLIDQANAVAVQSDGKTVVAGFTVSGLNNVFAVTRYNVNGSLDTTFGGDGIATIQFGGLLTVTDQATSLAIQSDGKIVVAGFTLNGTQNDIAVARLNTDGSLDTTFDGDGRVTIGSLLIPEQASGVALQSDGKIVVTGFAGLVHNFAMARLNANGSVDTTFNGGFFTTPVGTLSESNGVVIQSDGKIVAAGWGFNGLDNDFAVVRYNTNGSLDTTFDGDGIALTPVGIALDQATSVALQADGKIVAAGFTFNVVANDFALVRYNTNGSLDTSFDGDGKVTNDFTLLLDDAANAVAIQSDGKIVAAGVMLNVTNNDFGLARYNVDGSLDTSFGGDGLVSTNFAALLLPDQANGVAIHSDGRIVAAGWTLGVVNNDFAVARYVGVNRPPIFGTIPDQTVAVGNTLTFTVPASDPDGDPLTYTASNLPTGATFNPATQTFTWTPTADQGPGNYAPVFTVSDGTDSASETVNVAVTGGTNDAPVLAPIGNKTVTVGNTLTFTVSATDADGDPLTFAALNLPASATFDTGTRTFTWTPTAAQAPGSYPVTFTASDGQVTDAEAISITVNAAAGANQAPVFTPIPNRTVPVGTNLTFTVSATDGDGDPLTFSASNLPTGATFDPGTRTFSWTPTVPQGPGVYTVTFTADDGETATSANGQITVTGGTNQSPVFPTIDDKTVNVGENLTFGVTANDPDGDPLTYSASNLPPGATFNPATQTFSWTPATDQGPGNYPVTFTVDDGKTAVSQEVIVHVVGGTNRPPVLNPIPDQEVEVDGTLVVVLEASDPDGDPLTFSSPDLPPNATLDPNTGVFTFTPDDDQWACFDITFTVSDGGLDNSQTMMVMVTVDGNGPGVRLFRAYNRTINAHFFTTSQAEFTSATTVGGYEDETTGRGGIGVVATPLPGAVPMHRLYNPNLGTHYYTLDTNERDFLVTHGWRFEKDEGYMFFTQSDCAVEIFRLYNNDSGVHLFTDQPGIRDAILAQFPGIWVLHNSLGYAYPLAIGQGFGHDNGTSASAHTHAAVAEDSEAVMFVPSSASSASDDETSNDPTVAMDAAAEPVQMSEESAGTEVAANDSPAATSPLDDDDAVETDNFWELVGNSLRDDPLANMLDWS